MKTSLIQKYNVPGPRYTSYPTVPYWDEQSFDVNRWGSAVRRTYRNDPEAGLSLYIHLPFCESLCTFCGCFKRVTKNHSHEATYIQALKKEWLLYVQLIGRKPLVREIHLGGGTPTFFSARHLEELLLFLFAHATIDPECDMGFEGHPNSTTREHLEKLYKLGFRRVSFGVQDYSEKVQHAIHRIQPFDAVAKATYLAREIGYTCVGHDLIYGLPFQTLDDVQDTIEKTRALRPDRLAFYSYAHVPWQKGNGQRGFLDEDLPRDEVKRQLYETGKTLLQSYGYKEIGMDHFALETDNLYKSYHAGKLHRNFMGYTASHTRLMVGLGVSAIGDSWEAFGQNVKSLTDYYQMLEWGSFPIAKGHALTDEDLLLRQHILNLMCRFETSWKNDSMFFAGLLDVIPQLEEFERDGLIEIKDQTLHVLPAGRAFIRNICMAFDLRLYRNKPETQLFSMTI